MSIMAGWGRPDARSGAWLLADTVSKRLKVAEGRPEDHVLLNNAYRMLRAHSAHGYVGYLGRPDVTAMAKAIQDGIDAAYEGDVDMAIEDAKVMLRSMVAPEKYGETTPDERTRCLTLFERVRDDLKASF